MVVINFDWFEIYWFVLNVYVVLDKCEGVVLEEIIISGDNGLEEEVKYNFISVIILFVFVLLWMIDGYYF